MHTHSKHTHTHSFSAYFLSLNLSLRVAIFLLFVDRVYECGCTRALLPISIRLHKLREATNELLCVVFQFYTHTHTVLHMVTEAHVRFSFATDLIKDVKIKIIPINNV